MARNELLKKNSKKEFTKLEKNIIINTDYIPLKVNYENLFKKDGVVMDKTKEVILNEEKNILIKEHSKSKKFIELLRKICNDFGIDDYKTEIRKFLQKKI